MSTETLKKVSANQKSPQTKIDFIFGQITTEWWRNGHKIAGLNSSYPHGVEKKRLILRRPSMGEENDILNVAEAAKLLRIHPITLRRRAVAWGVPHKRLGSEWRFSRAVLTAWIQQRGSG